jgi:hypothetical protein
VAQAGGAESGPSGRSRRMTAWKWTAPRRWYSATLAYDTSATRQAEGRTETSAPAARIAPLHQRSCPLPSSRPQPGRRPWQPPRRPGGHVAHDGSTHPLRGPTRARRAHGLRTEHTKTHSQHRHQLTPLTPHAQGSTPRPRKRRPCQPQRQGGSLRSPRAARPPAGPALLSPPRSIPAGARAAFMAISRLISEKGRRESDPIRVQHDDRFGIMTR